MSTMEPPEGGSSTPPPPPPPPPPVPPGYPAPPQPGAPPPPGYSAQGYQGTYPSTYAHPPGYQASRQSGRAVAVLVLGIVGLFMICGWGVGAIPAIVALALAPGAKREIRGSAGTVTGEGFVKAGVICSWVTIGLTILGIVMFVGLLLLGVFASSVDTDHHDTYTQGGSQQAAALGVRTTRNHNDQQRSPMSGEFHVQFAR